LHKLWCLAGIRFDFLIDFWNFLNSIFVLKEIEVENRLIIKFHDDLRTWLSKPSNYLEFLNHNFFRLQKSTNLQTKDSFNIMRQPERADFSYC
jgi:hypothetical protein